MSVDDSDDARSRRRERRDSWGSSTLSAKRQRVEASSSPTNALFYIRDGPTGKDLYKDSLTQFEDKSVIKGRQVRSLRGNAYEWEKVEQRLKEYAPGADGWYMSICRRGQTPPQGKPGVPIATGADFRAQIAKYAQDGALPQDDDGYYAITIWVYAASDASDDMDDGVAAGQDMPADQPISGEAMDEDGSRSPMQPSAISSGNGLDTGSKAVVAPAEPSVHDEAMDEDDSKSPIAEATYTDSQDDAAAAQGLGEDDMVDEDGSTGMASYIDLTQEDDSDGEAHMEGNVYDNEGDIFGDVQKPELALWSSIDRVKDEDWGKVARFFGIKATERCKKLQGTHMALDPHQMQCIYWSMSQPAEHGFAGGVIGDEMGLGKTLESIAYLFCRFLILKLQREVQNEQDDTQLADKERRHLPDGPQQPGAKCPSQNDRDLECYCVETSATRSFATALPEGVAVFATRPTVVRQVVGECDRYFDWEHDAVRGFQVLSNHESVGKSSASAHAFYAVSSRLLGNIRDHVFHKARKTKNVNEPAYLEYRLQPRAGQAGTVFIVSSTGFDSFVNIFNKPFQVPNSRQNMTANRLAAGVIILDEMHEYKGVNVAKLSSDKTFATVDGKTTLPFQYLRLLRKRSLGYYAPLAFGLTGTPMPIGPADMINVVIHVDMMQHRLRNVHSPGTVGPLTVQCLTLQTTHNRLVKQLGKPDIGPDVQLQLAEYKKEQMEFVGQLVLRRRGVDHCLGKPILDLKPANVQRVNLPAGEEWRGPIQQLKDAAEEETRKMLQDHMKETGGSRGKDKATIQQLEQHFREQQLKKGNSWWWLLRQAACFPALAALVRDEGLKQYVRSGAITQAKLPDKLSKAMIPTANALNLVQGAAQASPFWPYLQQLLRGNSKLTALITLVRGVDNLEGHNEHPVDKSRSRHMVVLCPSPNIAYLTVLALVNEFPAIEKYYLHASQNAIKRAEMQDEFKRPVEPNDGTRILITTTTIAGAGLNLQRANYCVLLGLDWLEEQQDQALARVHRKGQMLRTHLYIYYDSTNEVESSIYSRQASRDKLSGPAATRPVGELT